MGKYLLKRIGQMLLVVIIVTVVTFFMVDLVPGDPVIIVAGTEDLDQALINFAGRGRRFGGAE